ncbi:hypothetical protein OROMI_000828 [Orobanche minor]
MRWKSHHVKNPLSALTLSRQNCITCRLLESKPILNTRHFPVYYKFTIGIPAVHSRRKKQIYSIYFYLLFCLCDSSTYFPSQTKTNSLVLEGLQKRIVDLMAEEIITILCYGNGKITLGSHGLAYEGPPPKPIRVNNRISYKEVVDEIYNVTGFNKIQMGIKITCRYPSNFKEYIAVPVEDNNTVSVVFDVLMRPDISCLEFYVESFPRGLDEQIEVPQVILSGPFTRLLTQEIGVLDSEFVFSTIESDGFLNISTCAVEESVAHEGFQCVMEGTEINNDLIDDYSDEADEGIDGEEYIIYEQAPIPGFTNIDQINDAVVDASMQGKECPQKDDGELYIGQRFTKKDEMQAAVKLIN